MTDKLVLLSRAIQDYLDDCYALSGSTQALYAWHLARLLQAIGDQPVRALTDGSQLRSFMASLRCQDSRPYSPAFLDQAYRTLHSFWAWCVQQEFCAQNPMDRVRRPRVPQRKSPRLTLEQVDRLLQVVATDGWYPERNLAMVCLMVDSGLRRAEVIRLKVTDVDLIHGVATVYGKGKEREVPLGQMTLWTIQRYLAVRPDGDALFVSRRGNPLTTGGLHTLMYRLKEKTGIPGLRCHLLRHTFANWYIANGGSLRRLQMILGHSDIHTTAAIYTSPELGELQEEHARVSPLASLSLQVPVAVGWEERS